MRSDRGAPRATPAPDRRCPPLAPQSEALAPARCLLWPSRIEGRSRIAREARAAGTVPVALSTNPYATAGDHGDGVVLCRNVDDLAPATRALLADPDRLAGLAARGAQSARAQVDWPGFVGRVDAALGRIERRAGASARHEFGRLVAGRAASHAAEVGRLRAQVRTLAGAAARLEDAVAELRAAADEQSADIEARSVELAQRSAELHQRTDELQVLAAERDRLQAELAAATATVGQFCRRRIVRLVDRTPLRHLGRRARPVATGAPAAEGAHRRAAPPAGA